MMAKVRLRLISCCSVLTVAIPSLSKIFNLNIIPIIRRNFKGKPKENEKKFKKIQTFSEKRLDFPKKKCIIYLLRANQAICTRQMRKWRNWQTRTFEGRVVYTVRVQVPFSAPKKTDRQSPVRLLLPQNERNPYLHLRFRRKAKCARSERKQME